MEGKGILLHKHSVALVDGEAKSPDPSILRYGEIAINYATDHETISIKNQNDEIATFKTHKLYTQLLGDKQDKTDDTLLTQDKTITGALNELKTDLDDSVEPYVVNLTNLLSANDSESISAAIGGIENLNSTISKNQVIFGVLATGTVAVGIRVFGNQTTLNYFVDSVLGLTINEIAITNTDNTLSKTVETHAVLTENMVINSLNSDETTLPLSAAQGKALDSKIIDLNTDLDNKQNVSDESLNTTDKTVVGAINEILPKATGVGKIDPESNGTGEIFNTYNNNKAKGEYAHAEGTTTEANGIAAHAEGSNNIAGGNYSHAEGYQTIANGIASHAEGVCNYDETNLIHTIGIGASPSERKNAIAIERSQGLLYLNGVGNYQGQTIYGKLSVQEVLNGKQDTLIAGTGIEITPENQINVTLDTTVFKVVSVLPDSPAQGDENKIHLVSAETSGANNTYTEYVWVNSAWEILGEYTSEVDLTPYLKTVDAADTYLSKTDAASTYQPVGDYATTTVLTEGLTGKQDATDDNLDTTDKTIVGAINEILPKATGVGKIDPNSDGTGEVFNDYTNNKASGRYAHAEGWSTTASGIAAHAEGRYTTASGNYAHAEGWYTTAHGNYAHAEGHNTIASMTAAHAEGFCNFDDSDAIHMVGIGTSDSDRKNAHVIKPGNGEHFIIGIGGYEGQATDSAQSLQEVINGKQDALTRLDVSTLFADSATTTSELSSQIAAYGESTATDFPLMYAGDSIGNIKPTWIRTNAGVTNFMCIADNKIWYFEIQGTTVQRASLSIS